MIGRQAGKLRDQGGTAQIAELVGVGFHWQTE